MIFSNNLNVSGIIGWPTAHSLSPKLHNYWLKQYNVDGAYIPLPTPPDGIDYTIKSLKQMGFIGANVTIPHKQKILTLVDELDLTAQHIGAINTISITNGIMKGFNTDVDGFINSIKSKWKNDGPVVVLGAGGAARAIVFALIRENVCELRLINRDLNNAQALANNNGKQIRVIPWEKRSDSLENASLLVNTTALGMENYPQLDINLNHLPHDALVMDIVYQPLLTSLLIMAQKRQNPIITGLDMLIYQAILSFEIWYGIKPEISDDLRNFMGLIY